MGKDFLNKITEVIQDNISNEQFGVSELASEIGMSRSNLLRKVKQLTKLSVSQFISQVRLKHAMSVLRESSLTVSEVSYEVGFSSPSYFIKCFHDFYGYPPGEVGKREITETDSENYSDDNYQGDHSTYSHQLAAIMFTDIQGYTAIMQQDEGKALKFRNRHREVIEAVTDKYKGKILQYFGDGTLSTFNSAIDAVRCGIELQLAFREEPRLPVRIGVHTGDIIFTDDGIIGDGVNVASRIESLAVAHSVFISEKVYDEVKNQSGIQTTSMGVFELKNVNKPVEVYAIANPGLVVPDRGEISGKAKSEVSSDKKDVKATENKSGLKWVLLIIFAVLTGGYLLYNAGIFDITTQYNQTTDQIIAKKSIAVLPFRNDSNDSSNVYIINGLMESTLSSLQNIENLRVISRTSVEKYRNNPKTIPEIARELNVKYLIEGSGQKIGDQIMLHIQLIDAQTDKHLWSEQYTREAKDIFKLQMEVANNIINQIEVIITPEEEERINSASTENLVAYDYFLKGLDLLKYKIPENLVKSIAYFESAIKEDPEYARAYAAIAMAYYFLDQYKAEKKYGDKINHYADEALLYDSKLPQSLIAKALYYMQNKEYELAVSYFEKALKYKPNYDLVYVFLVELYASHIPDTEKYLEYALKRIDLDVAAYDSITVSYSYVHISNAFIQSGFIDEAEEYINKSLTYYPGNLASEYLKAYILFAKNRDLAETKKLLLEALSKDSTRLDIMQEVGKICYFMRDYDCAYIYYSKFLALKEAYHLDIYNAENAIIGVVYSKMGMDEESIIYFDKFKEYVDNDQTIYKHLNLAMYYSYHGDTERAIEELELFSQEDNYFYWIVVFLDMGLMVDNIKDLPEYKKIASALEIKFWKNHEQMKAVLEEKGLL